MKLSKKMQNMLAAIPVWPKEVYLEEVCKEFGVSSASIPTYATIGVYEGRACYFDKKTKEKLLRRFESEID